MMSIARQHVVQALQDGLTGVTVIPYARGITPAGPTVLVRVDQVTPVPQAPIAGYRIYQVAVLVVTPLIDPTGPADDAADELLERVLAVVEATPDLTWSTAARVVVDDTLLGYQVTLTIHATPKGTP